MLNLTNEFTRVAPHEKKKIQLLSSVMVCHIDESALFQEQSGTVQHLESMMKEQYPNMEFKHHRMEDIFKDEFMGTSDFDQVLKCVDDANKKDNEHLVQFLQADQSNAPADHGERLRLLFSNIIKNTSKESLYWHLKMTMLLTIARREGCSFIFMGDSSTLQAIKMISMTSQGRGYSIPFDVGVENDTSFKDLVILRPMKDMLAKEIAYYNTIVGLNKYVVAPTNWATKMPAKSSIERLTEDFIVSLDKDFPSTVSTISRTASKLTPSKNLDLQRTCAICSL
ncbi:uncharacterized protein BYT42DRAFT_591227 [Radiomyces spectabilis]|uniref:uncharacterized protein n=1 Tax=Radiomyces spectabilis TaxID=64574 RepID=UPI00221EC4A0|nr:uncharacterized protein BYT42DRAFT_591227 [Radiomyces spectabilis]KAI8393454.1 hypothetical protein BYT42DRAFT_591227 [Radiomyces spectabilis]